MTTPLPNCRTRAYHSWSGMKQRITNPKDPKYPNYGGRGLDMDQRWMSFGNFLADMGQPPTKTTIGRIDNERGYWPDNCRWETATQQSNNTCMNVRLTAFGRTQTMTQWAQECDIKLSALNWRIKDGWDIERALTTPTMLKRVIVRLRCVICDKLFEWETRSFYIEKYGVPHACGSVCRAKTGVQNHSDAKDL